MSALRDLSAATSHALADGLSEETEDKYLAEVIHEQVKAELEKAMIHEQVKAELEKALAESTLFRKVEDMRLRHELLRKEFQAYRSAPAVAAPASAHDNGSPAFQKLQKEFSVLQMAIEEWQVRDQKQIAGVQLALEERQVKESLWNSEKLIQVEERLGKLEKAFTHSVLHEERLVHLENASLQERLVHLENASLQERLVHLENTWSNQAPRQASPEEVHVPRLDALSTKIEDIQKWQTEVDDALEVNGRERVSNIEKQPNQETEGDPERQISPGEASSNSRHQYLGVDHTLPVFLRPCVWDYAFLVALPKHRNIASLCVLYLLYCSVFFQVFLCLAINDLFTVPVIDSGIVQEMHEWRIHVAHRVEFMDTNKGVPMARSLCSFATSSADSVSRVYDLIEKYLPTKEYYAQQQPIIGPLLPYNYYVGIGLSAVACLIWCLRLVEDIDDVYDIVQAVNNLPVKDHTEIEFGPQSSKVFAVSRQRKMCFFLVMLLELLVLGFLGFTGVAYIINTLELTDLLLNCSALAIVLDIDIYVAHCMPKMFQHTLEGMKPISRPISGRGLEFFFKMVLVSAVTVVATVAMQVDARILEDARTVICGGNLDFVVGEDASGVLVALKTPGDPVERDVYIERAMEQLLDHDHGNRYVTSWFSKEDMSAPAKSMEGGPWGFHEWVAMGPEQCSGIWNYECVDMLPSEASPYPYSKHFEHILGDLHVSETPISHCGQMKQYCSQLNLVGRRVRQICPMTCGCHDPGYTLVMLPAKYGCPSSCAFSAAYNSSMWSRECEDLNVSSPDWSQYHEGLSLWFTEYGAPMDDSLAQVKELGCESIYSLKLLGQPWLDPCQAIPEVNLKPLTWACPVSCGCHEHDQHFCPRTCRVSVSR